MRLPPSTLFVFLSLFCGTLLAQEKSDPTNSSVTEMQSDTNSEGGGERPVTNTINELATNGSRTLPQPELKTFEERRMAILEAYCHGGGEHFQNAECLFALNRPQEGLKEVNLGLDALVPGNKINRWMHGGNTGFIAWPGIDCYIRFEKFLDPATKERYRKIYTGGVFYQRLSTANHIIMAAMTRYLATQVWGADAFHADPWFMANDPYIQMMTAKRNKPGVVWGTSFTGGDETGEKYLNSVIDFTIRNGPGEFASRPYGAQNILPLLTIADCAKDQTLARKARMAYEMCLVQLAPAWLHGHLATFAPRSYPDTECQRPWGMASLPWIYFGGIAPSLDHAKAAVEPAISNYKAPELIVNAANDRKSPYFYRAHINGWALNHYVNVTYALFSRSAKVGGRPWQGQSYPCGVMWEQDPEKGSHLWVTAPSEDIPGQMGNHTHGVRTFEQEVLGRDAMLFNFRIPPGTDFPYALCYVPGGHLAHVNDSKSTGRIFLHYGGVLIAVAASQPFDWSPDGGIYAPANKPRAGDSEFRVKSLSCAVAIETAASSEFPGATPEEQLAKFREAVMGKSSLTFSSSAQYKNRLGDTLECTFDGTDSVNGVVVDYTKWPTSQSPWTSQPTPTSPMILTDGKTERIYDFTNWTISDRGVQNPAKK